MFATRSCGNALLFLVETNKERPATKYDMEVFFQSRRNGDIPTNTFVQKVKRLREKLGRIGVPTIIDSCSCRGETAYYYNGLVDYIIMYRSDYTFMFDDEW